MLKLYRRHSAGCEFAGSRRYDACTCPVWITGTVDGKRCPRQSTGTRSWREATEIKRSMEAGATLGTVIDEAIEAWLASMRIHTREGTSSVAKQAMAYFSKFCSAAGIRNMTSITTDHVAKYKDYLTSRLSLGTSRTYFQCLRNFMSEAEARGWVDKNPARPVRGVRHEQEIANPMTDEEIERLITHIKAMKPLRTKVLRYPETFAAFIRLMSETGMRRSDCMSFRPAMAVKSDDGLWIYEAKQIKSGRPMTAFISDKLMQEIARCRWLGIETPFMGSEDDPIRIARTVWDLLQRIGRQAGIPDCRTHRIRDAFAVRMLTRGMSTHDVARLLGHASVVTTERYYAKWTPGRLRRLQDAFHRAAANNRVEDRLGDD